jgi:transcriptional regulator with XRE-family HTH domain
MDTLGTRIRALRRARDWTQKDLASRADTDFRYISELEKDHIANPGRDLLQRLARAFGVPIGELIDTEPDLLAGPWPAATMQALGLTEDFLLRYKRIWPDLNREQRAWVVGHLRIMADAERKIRALEGRAPRGEPDSAPEAGGHLEIIPGCV